MISRLSRTFGCLAILVIAYRAYAWIAVPIIEPSARARKESTVTAGDLAKASSARSHERKKLERWFPPGSWELAAKMVIETPRGKLLINEYSSLPDGRLKLTPCTMVFLPDSKGDEEARLREAVILQVPGGAELEFDQPPDMKRFQVGNVVGGVLPGPFTIRSDYKHPGPNDDLLITARDAQLKGNRVISPHPIKFKLGANHGSGRDVEIDLGTGAIGAKPTEGVLQLDGIKSFTVKREVAVFLDVGKGGLFRGLQPTPNLPAEAALGPVDPRAISREPTQNASPSGGTPEELPLRIACQGPFHFEMARMEASFEDRVDVLRLNPGKQSDRLQCQRLSLFFTPNVTGELLPNPSKPGAPGRLRPARIEAYGQPVTVDSPGEAPGEDIEAVGEILRYDLLTHEASLEGEHPVTVRRGANKIIAPRVQFQPVPGRKIGKFSATGPGSFEGVAPEDPTRTFRAFWKQLLSFGPEGGSELFSLRGDSRVEMVGFGGLAAEEIHVWLEYREPPPGLPNSQQAVRAAKPGLQMEGQPFIPQKLLAKGSVRIDSTQLLGRVDEMQIWFKPAPPQLSRLPDGRPYEELPPPPGSPAVAAQQGARTRGIPGLGDPKSRQRFRVTGGLLQAEVLVGGAEPQVGKLRIHEKARVVETQTQNPAELPLLINGHDIDYEQTDPAHGVLVVSGAPIPGKPNELAPAHVEGRGMTLDGGTIRLDRGRNTLTIDGPGAMSVLANRDLAGKAVERRQPLAVQWQRGLTFDGIAAQFSGTVVCDFDNHQLRTEQLDVTFQERVNFSGTPDQRQPELATIACHGSVLMSGRTFSDGKLASIEQMQGFDLTFDRVSGAIHADGPGAMTMVRRGSFQLPGQETRPAPRAGDNAEGSGSPRVQTVSTGDSSPSGVSEDLPVPSSSATQPEAEEFTYLHVEFPRELSGTVPLMPGDLRPWEVVFSERVKTTYGPVASWEGRIDADDIDRQLAAGENSAQSMIFLQSRQLIVSEAPSNGAVARREIEIEASGNVEIQGINFEEQNFFARADRLSYAAGKDLMILQGDPATFARQNPYWTGAGGKIFYWPRTKRFKVERAQAADVVVPAGS